MFSKKKRAKITAGRKYSNCCYCRETIENSIRTVRVTLTCRVTEGREMKVECHPPAMASRCHQVSDSAIFEPDEIWHRVSIWEGKNTS